MTNIKDKASAQTQAMASYVGCTALITEKAWRVKVLEWTKEEVGEYEGANMTKIYINRDGGGTPHLLHFVITVLTCGLWLPVWIVCWLVRG